MPLAFLAFWTLLRFLPPGAAVPARAQESSEAPPPQEAQTEQAPVQLSPQESERVRRLEKMVNDMIRTPELYDAAGLEKLSPEEREILSDINPEVKIVTTPLVKKLLQMSGQAKTGTFVESAVQAIGLHRFLIRQSVNLVRIIWGLSAAFVLIGAGGFLSGKSVWSRDAAAFAYEGAKYYLGAVSVLAPLAALLARVNLWSVLPASLWFLPGLNLVVGALFLWLMEDDFNIFRALSSGLRLPALSLSLVLIAGAFLTPG